MPNRNTLKSFLAAFLVTIVLAGAALVIALAASTSGGGANGISAYAGGVSQRFLKLLTVTFPVAFIAAFLIVRRTFR